MPTTLTEQRHPNPQLDPRRPTLTRRSSINPPTFVWKPQPGQTRWDLIVARDEALTDPVLTGQGLDRPYHLPSEALPPGRYFWAWGAEGAWAPALPFDIDADDRLLEVPPTDELLQRIPAAHPRLFIQADALEALRASRATTRAPLWERLRQRAEKALAESHELPEPAPVADYHTQHAQWECDYHASMHASRAFLGGAQTLSLAYLASGEEQYGRAAAQRLLSVAAWDPAGSTHIEKNDEPHMSIMGTGPYVADWVWDLLSAEEQGRVAWMFGERLRLARAFMDKLGHFGADHYGSHHGREITFLGTLCIGFHDCVAGAPECLDWLRTLMGGVWPVWAGEDGAWAEGPHYATAYVNVSLNFIMALRQATGVDLLRRPFWANYVEWRRWCVPLGTEWIGFGDGQKVSSPEKTPAFVNEMRRIAHFVNGAAAAIRCPQSHADAAAEAAAGSGTRPLDYLVAPELAAPPSVAPEADSGPAALPDRVLRVFPDGGWAAIRTDLETPERDIALTIRSSPFGAVSHSHADNNGFALQVAGRSLLVPSGFYDGYESNHHAHYVWHTKSANCLTLSDAGQIMRSGESTGRIADPYEDDCLAYLRAEADGSYADRTERCRRHVVFLKESAAFVLIDEVQVKPGLVSALQWNAHAWSPFVLDEEAERFTVQRADASVEGWFLWHAQGFFQTSDEESPPPVHRREYGEQQQEYHLRYTPWGLVQDRRHLGVVLTVQGTGRPQPRVRTARSEAGEEAWIDEAHLTVYPEGRRNGTDMEVASLQIDGRTYRLGDDALACME